MTGTATRPAERVTRIVSAAREALAARADELDDLNVFPVADGDTGANMLVTVAAVEASCAATTGLPRAERCAALARAALMGARGNSGMILSQLVRGAAEVLAGEQGELTGVAVARALRRASDAGYAAVRAPVEGTMLTVARRIAEAAQGAADDGLVAVLDAARDGGRAGVAQTPDLLPVLRDAGVVDAGGLGLSILLEGLAAAALGRPPPAATRIAPPRAPAVDHPPSRYRYCTSFLVEGAAIDLEALETALAPLGDSLLVMGDPTRAKVHVHTDAPERAAAAAAPWGVVDGLRWDDMRRQEAERTARLARRDRPAHASVALVVAHGEGVRELLDGLGATAVAAAALAAALDGVAGCGAVVLAGPEDARVAREAARGRAGVEVVEVAGVPAALSALVEMDPAAPAADNAAHMRAAAERVAVVAVEGSGPELRPALAGALDPLLAGGEPALVTVLVGRGAGVDPVVVEGWVRELAAGAEVEVEAHAGGQAAPALAIGVE